jgi:hypothetical protein
MQVGRSVVREAHRTLTLLGLVEVRQGDGSYIKETESHVLPAAIEWGLLLGARQTEDLVEARCLLEVLVGLLRPAFRSAVLRPPSNMPSHGWPGSKSCAFLSSWSFCLGQPTGMRPRSGPDFDDLGVT